MSKIECVICLIIRNAEMVFLTKSFQWVSTIFKFNDTQVLLAAREEDGKLTLWLMSYEKIEDAAEKCAAKITVVLSEVSIHKFLFECIWYFNCHRINCLEFDLSKRQEEFPLDIFHHPEDPSDKIKHAAILSLDEVRHNLYGREDSRMLLYGFYY